MSTARRSAERARLEAEGAEAHAAGKRRTQCPYYNSMTDARDWLSGWDRADREATSAREDAAAGSKYALAEAARSADLGELRSIVAQLIERLPDEHFSDA